MNPFLLAYLKLNHLHRGWIIAIGVFTLISFAYFPRYNIYFSTIKKLHAEYQQSKSRYAMQQQSIKSITAMRNQLAELEKKADSSSSPSKLTETSRALGIKNFSSQPSETHLSIRFNTSLQTFFAFLDQASPEISHFKLQQLSLSQDNLNHEIQVEIALEKNNDTGETTKPSAFSVQADQTEWLGILTSHDHAPMAFLKLPDQKIVGLSPGETYGSSSWKLQSVQPREIKLQDASGKIIARSIP